ncbi:MAG: hypothetical protein QM820_59155 [Minicystis sp.]
MGEGAEHVAREELLHQDERRARGDGAHHGVDEAVRVIERRRAEDAVGRADGHRVDDVGRLRDELSVRARDALGAAGGAGRVLREDRRFGAERDGGAGCRAGDRAVGIGEARAARLAPEDQLRPARGALEGAEHGRHARVGGGDAHLAVGEVAADLVLRELGVQGHRDGADARDREERDHEIDGVRQEDGDALARRDVRGPERGGEGIDALAERLVREARPAGDDGLARGPERDGALDQGPEIGRGRGDSFGVRHGGPRDRGRRDSGARAVKREQQGRVVGSRARSQGALVARDNA